MPTNIVARWALVALVCGIACDAEPDEEVALETEQVMEPAEGGGESLGDEDQFRASYSCILQAEEEEEEEEEDEIYCLVKCKGYKWTRAVKSSVDVKELTDYWCEKRAKKFCDNVGREYDDWCWGIRD
jgi:hypothetical protein